MSIEQQLELANQVASYVKLTFGEVYFQAAIQFPVMNEIIDACVLPGKDPRAFTMHESYFIPVLKVWKEQADLAAQEGRR